MITSSYLTVKEVAPLLGVSESKAYKVIQNLNKELKANGYITVAGKVPKKYFKEKTYCDDADLGLKEASAVIGIMVICVPQKGRK